MPRKRLDYLDMAKGVGIFLVVLGHIEYLEESAMRWIFSFHMPLFFVIGGILTYMQEAPRDASPPLTVGEILKKRAGGTLIPYASFSLILLTMRVFELFFQPALISKGELLRQLVDSLTGYGLHTLWFLPVYCLAGMLFFLLEHYLGSKRYGQYGVCVLILALTAAAFGLIYGFRLDQYPVLTGSLLWHGGMNLLIVLLRTMTVLPFFLIGWYYGKAETWGIRQKRGRLFVPGALMFALGTWNSQRVSILDLHYLYIYPMHYLTAALSCLGLLDMLRALPVSRILSYLGRNSLVIMCTHAPFYVLYYVSLGMFFVRKFIPMADPVFYGCIALVACGAEIPLIRIFNRYFYYLLGRKS